MAIEEAELDKQEQQWLTYFAGAFLGRIKKTRDKRYYFYSPSIAKSKQDTKVVIV